MISIRSDDETMSSEDTVLIVTMAVKPTLSRHHAQATTHDATMVRISSRKKQHPRSPLDHATFRPTRSQPTLPSSATTASYDGIGFYHGPAGSPLALGTTNTTNGAVAASDDDGGNGCIFTHFFIVDQLNDHHLLQPFSFRLNTSIRDGCCR